MHRLRGHEATARQCGRARRQGPGAVQRGAHTPDEHVMAGDLRILEGATFCICDELGDLHGKVEGLFAEDTRFLSSLKLTINGERPLLLSSDKIEYFSAAFFMRNPLALGLAQDSLSIRRERFVGDLPLKTQVILSQRGEVSDSTMRFHLALEPRERWDLHVEVIPLPDGELVAPRFAELRFGEEVGRVRDSLAAWQLRVPQLRASWDALSYSFAQSVSDLASLRMRSDNTGIGKLPGAGVPWFMTVFGRDTIITCLQTLLFGPELARTALEVLADLQAKDDNPALDAEPGKIVHEVRHGKAARTWFERYYGTVDATPLYLILVSAVCRWTDDIAFMRDLKAPALAALDWIDKYGDRDGDGFVEYERRTEQGLDNQSWKDSWDSQRFHDGRIADPPIAPCEVQGYVYDAKRRIAEIAREVWRDRALADKLEQEADELRERFDAAFWVDDRGGYYALALDGQKQKVDALCSNIGHLLWSGIVPPQRVDAIVDQLMGDDLWSGWGVRTMSTADAGYNPLAYHNGTVWPHDNSLVAWGLARYARWPEAQRIIQRMLSAAAHFDYQLPEVFAGMRRSETPFPIAYPTAARPQAWAAG